MKQRHSTTIAEIVIHRLIESLYHLFLVCRSKNEELGKIKAKILELDANNPDYNEMHHDKRENMKAYLRLITIPLSCLVDFLLVFQTVSVLCDHFSLPGIFAFLLPLFLVVIEVAVSYFQILHNRIGEHASWLTRNVQYFVLLFLVGITLIGIVFAAEGYDPKIDKIGFTAYLAGTILFQVALLIASLLLHLWLIRNSEALAESIAYFIYKTKHNALSKKNERIEQELKKKDIPTFSKSTHNLAQKVESFKREHPNANIDFRKTTPRDLTEAIDKIIGRNVFAIEAGVSQMN